MEIQGMHDAVSPMKWLVGKWVGENGSGFYPTINDFKYCEEIEFTSFGQPLLQYTAKSWHPVKKNPMHFESGFLRIKPGSSEVALMVAHNFGLTTLERGSINGQELILESQSVDRMSFAKDPSVKKIERRFRLNEDGQLEQKMFMETARTAMTQHLVCVYNRVDDG